MMVTNSYLFFYCLLSNIFLDAPFYVVRFRNVRHMEDRWSSAVISLFLLRGSLNASSLFMYFLNLELSRNLKNTAFSTSVFVELASRAQNLDVLELRFRPQRLHVFFCAR